MAQSTDDLSLKDNSEEETKQETIIVKNENNMSINVPNDRDVQFYYYILTNTLKRL